MGVGIAELLVISALFVIPIAIGIAIVGVAVYSSRKSGNRIQQAHCPSCGQSTHIDADACPNCGCKLR